MPPGTATTHVATSAAAAGSDGSTTLTTKGYVEGLLTGQLVYAGGYDASTDPPTGASVLQGYTYVVTTAVAVQAEHIGPRH